MSDCRVREKAADGDPARQFAGLTGCFEDDVALARALRDRRLLLLPRLAARLKPALADDLARLLAAADWPEHALAHARTRPLLDWCVHSLFDAVSRGEDAGHAIGALRNLVGQPTTDVVGLASAPNAPLDVLMTLPEIGLPLDGVPIGLNGAERREAFLTNARGALAILQASGLWPRLAMPRLIVPIDQGEAEQQHSLSVCHLPDVVFVNAGSPGMVAELIVHEQLHLVLHAVAETRPLLPRPCRDMVYSPWRTTPRPVEALLHGLYVFSGVLLFWLDQLDMRAAEHRAARLAVQLEFGLRSLPAVEGTIPEMIRRAARRAVAAARRRMRHAGSAFESAFGEAAAHRARFDIG